MSGIYGDHGPFNVIVNPGAGNTDIVVSAFGQVQVRQSEAIAALGARVAAKDKPGNDILLVTCALIDEKGYTCPADQIIFQFLRDISASGVSIFPETPKHIKGIFIHLWNSPFISHWENGNDVPWIVW